MVPTGPVIENVVPASMIDFFQFPVPQWHERDGARYLGTWHLNISHDPETGHRGAGMYRMKALGPKQATLEASRRSDLARHIARAEAKKIQCGHSEAPAYSEIVIEGFVHPEERVDDGPHFDYQGKPHTHPKAYVFEATRLMHRDEPIFRGSALGKPGAEDYQVLAFLEELKLRNAGGSRLWDLVMSLFS